MQGVLNPSVSASPLIGAGHDHAAIPLDPGGSIPKRFGAIGKTSCQSRRVCL